MKHPIQKIVSVWLTMLAVTALLLMSCGTVHKTYSKDTSNTDSASITHTEEMSSGNHDSAVVKEQAGAYTKETVYIYDTLYSVQTVAGRTDTFIKYVPRIVKVYETGTTSTKQSGTYQNNDTGSKKSDANVVVKSEKKSIDKDTQRTGMSLGWKVGGGLLLLVAVAGYVLYRKYVV